MLHAKLSIYILAVDKMGKNLKNLILRFSAFF